MRAALAAVLVAGLCAACASTTPEEQAIVAMRDAMKAVDAGDLDAAAASARRASELRPGFVDPLMLLAAIAEERSEFDEARRLYREVLTHDPTDTAAGVAIGVTFVRQERLVEAQDWFVKAITADPGYEAAAFDLGSLSEQRGDPETAVAWFDVAATLDQRDPRALARIARIRLAQGRAEEALAAADAALRRYPKSRSAQEARSRALTALGRQ